MAEHRVELVECRGALAEACRLDRHCLGHLGDLGVALRQELVERRVEEADGHRQPVHDREQLDEIGALHRAGACRGRRGAPLHRRRGSSRAPRRCGPPGRTCARCGRGRCPRRRKSARPARRPGSRHWRGPASAAPGRPTPSACRSRRKAPAGASATTPASTSPVEPSTVMISPFLNTRPPAAIVPACVVDADRARARDAGLAHAARHHRGVAGHAAAGGEDAFGRVHAVDVLGAGLDADEDDLLARLLARPRLRPA